jgi:hypothetical protein
MVRCRVLQWQEVSEMPQLVSYLVRHSVKTDGPEVFTRTISLNGPSASPPKKTPESLAGFQGFLNRNKS